MAYVSEENEKRILELWEQDKTVEEILEAIGWGPKSGGNVTRVLRRAGYDIPYPKGRESVYELSKKNTPEMLVLESLLFERKTQEKPTPLFAGPDKELQEELGKKELKWKETRNLLPFGFMQTYRSADMLLKAFYKTMHNEEHVLVLIEGPTKRAKDLSKIITSHYQERGFTEGKQKDSQSTE
ncbi:hypothetical protein KY338_07120 [Candidatus Woesearchaeota archaeon]|nr:hypothetical protein [Candidatus Woesearchaeota archaeon]MBW3005828.1 hypothetical protein [Candidatus Woesearchaeota archaeon]